MVLTVQNISGYCLENMGDGDKLICSLFVLTQMARHSHLCDLNIAATMKGHHWCFHLMLAHFKVSILWKKNTCLFKIILTLPPMTKSKKQAKLFKWKCPCGPYGSVVSICQRWHIQWPSSAVHALKIRKALPMNWSHFYGHCTHLSIRRHGMLRMLFPVTHHWQGKRKQGDVRRIGFISGEAALTHNTNKETECILKDTQMTVMGWRSCCEHRDYPYSYGLMHVVLLCFSFYVFKQFLYKKSLFKCAMSILLTNLK